MRHESGVAMCSCVYQYPDVLVVLLSKGVRTRYVNQSHPNFVVTS